MADIKSLLNSIIDDGDHDRPITAANPTGNPYVKFNTTDFREKLSLQVLHDIIAAMMADDVKDVEGMIDESILRHIKDDYKGTCFGYLRNARDRLNGPILGDIVQEIEDRTEEARIGALKGAAEKDPAAITKEILDGVESYEELREKLRDEVTKKVVADVTRTITQSNDAPVFDGIDQKITVDKNKDAEELMNNQQQQEQEQEQNQEQEQEPAEQQQEENQQSQSQESPQPKSEDSEQMTPEEATQLLDAMRLREQSLRDQLQRTFGPPTPVEKDW